MKSAPRVVLDTNVVLSALVFARGGLHAIRFAWQRLHFRPLISKATTAELIRVLEYPKFKLSDGDQAELIGDYLPFCTVVKIPSRLPPIPHCRDPFDVPFLELAVCGKATALVTGDRDLLAIKEKLHFSIISPGEFLQRLEPQR